VKRSRLILAAVGIALSAAAVYLLLKQVGTRELVRNLRQADPLWLAGACVLTVAG
jgi:uncharacterized membrane protein YbhN (UPF0104 family)